MDTATETPGGATPLADTGATPGAMPAETPPAETTTAAPFHAAAGANGVDDALAFLGRHGDRDDGTPGSKARDASAAPVTTPAETTETAKTPPAGETPPAPKAAPHKTKTDDDEGSRKDPRIRINPKRWQGREADFAVVQLADQEGISLSEARARLFGPEAKATTPPGETPAAEATAEKDATALEAEIEALEAEADKAAEDFDRPKERKIEKEIKAKSEQLAALRAAQAQAQQAAAKAFDTQVSESEAAALALYPEAAAPLDGEEPTDMHLEVVAEIQAMQRRNDPLLAVPDFPELVAHRVAKRLGKTPAIAAAAPASARPQPTGKPPTTAPAVVPPSRTARPVLPAPGASTAVPTPTISREVAQRFAENDLVGAGEAALAAMSGDD